MTLAIILPILQPPSSESAEIRFSLFIMHDTCDPS